MASVALVMAVFILSGGMICEAKFSLEDIADGSEELLDMSLEYSENTPYWPTIEKKKQNFILEPTMTGHNDGFGYYYHATIFSSSDHGGTHVDALNHVNKNPINKDIDTTPLTQYFGKAFVVDISHKCSINPDYQLSVADLHLYETKHGRIPNDSVLFVYSGWGVKVMNKTAFWGSADYFNISTLHYPGVSHEAAEWLVQNRPIKLIGVETGSIDHGQGGLRLPTHATFLTNRINVIETVQNLHLLPPKGAFVFGLPMKIKGASGAPIRLVAVGWKKGNLRRRGGQHTGNISS
ncbi:hypothetical protein BV898_10995 [Hypsibius exemplaris]|uniref:Kynurenine formamidase n=1 Tax=Hypsibius exemplaris TaxID=2072580 RepID=A0A1W0WI05_HYPEX|nr:hypothetical protein BV898_10995 [Hypsibius exemplaris]